MFYRLAVGWVKGGEGLRDLLLQFLERQNISCITVNGDVEADAESDEVLISSAVAKKVASRSVDGGIIIDRCGIGGSIIANKFKSIRASRCTSTTTARYTRCHNDSNILCLGYMSLGGKLCLDIVRVWLNSEFEGGRHAISVDLIRCGEGRQLKGDLPDAAEDIGEYPDIRGVLEKVYLANDHAGFETKGLITRICRERGMEVVDMGTESTEIVRYPYYAARVAEKVKESPSHGGILICGTGIGMSIAANKFKGIRAALCTDEFSARYAREYLDSNVLCIGGKITGQFELEDMINGWLDIKFRENLQTILTALWKLENGNLQETCWKPVNNI